MAVEEFRAVLCVKAPRGMGPVRDDYSVKFCKHSGPSAAEDRPSAAESKDHIDNTEGIGIMPLGGAIVVFHQVACEGTGPLFIPGIRPYWYLTLDA